MDSSRLHFGTFPYFVSPKVVLFYPFCQRFLRELGNVADITIWSSMRVAIAKFVCDLIFKDLALKPINIMGQESCYGIKVQDNLRKVPYMKVKITNKQLFLTPIQNHLIIWFQ